MYLKKCCGAYGNRQHLKKWQLRNSRLDFSPAVRKFSKKTLLMFETGIKIIESVEVEDAIPLGEICEKKCPSEQPAAEACCHMLANEEV